MVGNRRSTGVGSRSQAEIEGGGRSCSYHAVRDGQVAIADSAFPLLPDFSQPGSEQRVTQEDTCLPCKGAGHPCSNASEHKSCTRRHAGSASRVCYSWSDGTPLYGTRMGLYRQAAQLLQRQCRHRAFLGAQVLLGKHTDLCKSPQQTTKTIIFQLLQTPQDRTEVRERKGN